METLARVYRGNAVESRHYGSVVVADTAGNVVWRTAEAPDEEPVFFRSAMKPLQALPLVESGAADAFGLTGGELALACASHSGDPVHVRTAQRMLARAPGLKVKDLRCGTHVPYSAAAAARLAREGRRPPVLCHNCSGKHIGMLLTCVHRGWPIEDYIARTHPLQREIKGIVARFADLPVKEVEAARDGCNLPACGVSLRRMAMTYARLASPAYWQDHDDGVRAAAVERLTQAMRAHPLLVSGKGRADLGLMSAGKGRLFSKIGAEAVWCLGFPAKGLGLALKIADGSNRAEIAIMGAALRQTGLLSRAAIAKFEAAVPRLIQSTDGTIAGRYEAALRLVQPS